MAVLPRPLHPNQSPITFSLASKLNGCVFSALTVFERFILSSDLIIISPFSLCILHSVLFVSDFGSSLWITLLIMDSDNSTAVATTPPAGKVRRCPCGRRMSSLTHDSHSLCIIYRGIDCDTDNRCAKCADVSEELMTTYVKHGQNLKRKLLSKKKQEGALSTHTVALDVEIPPSAVADLPSSPSPPSVTSDSPVSVDDSAPVSDVQGDILTQVKDLFACFSQSLEARYASIDSHISQGMSSASSVTVSDFVSSNVNQAVITSHSFSAPSVVAGHSEGVWNGLLGVRSLPSRPLCHPYQCQASSIYVSGSVSIGVETWHVTIPWGHSISLCLPSVFSAQAILVESSTFDRTHIGSGGAILAPQGVVRQPLILVGRRTTRASKDVGLTSATPCAEVPSRPRDPLASCVEVVQHLIRKAGFSKQVVRVTAADLRRSTAALYLSTWSRFLGWCDQQSIDPCKAFAPQIAEFFPCLRQVLGLSVPAV